MWWSFPLLILLSTLSLLPLLTLSDSTAIFKTGQKFQIILDSIPNLKASPTVVPTDAAVFDIDVFDTDADTIAGLQSQGKIVVCYFSAGTYEVWRPDAGNFTASDKGSSLAPDWPDENWLRVNSTNVMRIMENRIKLAASKGCDGVDPDNTDGYLNSNGLGLTRADTVTYVKFLASTANGLGLAVGLKNSMDLLSDVAPVVSFAVNEQCAQFSECGVYSSFLAAGKPVFHIEYPSAIPSIPSAERSTDCTNSGISGLSTVFKNITLSGWVGYCDGSMATTATKPGGDTNPWAPGKPHPTTKTRPINTATSTSTKSGSAPTSSTTLTTTTTSTKTTSKQSSTSTSSSAGSTATAGCRSKHWDQCGGNDWKGCTVCDAGLTCKGVSAPWYYQCL